MANEDFNGIMVFSENEKIALELLSKGRELAAKLGTPLLTILNNSDDEGKAKTLIAHGADKVIKITPVIEQANTEQYTNVISKLIEEYKPQIFLFGSNVMGKELAPRLASKFQTGSAADCIEVDLDENNNLKIKRIVYSGNGVATQIFNTKPQFATLALQTYKPLPRDDNRSGEIIEKAVEITEPRIKITNVAERSGTALRIEDAEFIISCGRGLKNKEDIQMIKDLAVNLHAEVGCSRPIASDLKWMGVEHWVGLSGHKVKPKIYIACGISGQIQHLAGMRDSDIIIAINKDSEAPIFNAADYGIVGDIYKIVPALIEKTK